MAGERRLRACKLLGWGQIPVHMLDTKDEAHDLAVEMSENNLRRNFTGSELAEGIRRQMALESEKAKERMADGGRGANICTPSGKSRDKAAEQFGISGEQARKTLFVDDNRDMLEPADFADWDEGKLSTNKAFQRIKAAMAQAEQQRDEARQEMQDVYLQAENMELEVERLKDQLKSRPQREVVREVVPKETQRRISELEKSNKQFSEDYEDLRRRFSSTQTELEQARKELATNESTLASIRDIQALTRAMGEFVGRYSGHTWPFADIDEQTMSECARALRGLSTFVDALKDAIHAKGEN